jgi:hypothetical protein
LGPDLGDRLNAQGALRYATNLSAAIADDESALPGRHESRNPFVDSTQTKTENREDHHEAFDALLENLKLDELAANNVSEFAFVMQPLKLQGATGSTVAPAAIR